MNLTRITFVLAFVACKPVTPAPATIDMDASIAPSGGATSNNTTTTNNSNTNNELASTRDGATLFASLCAVCHGADATGYKADNAPSLVNATFLESASDEQLRSSIIDGRPGTSMAAYGTERGGPLGTDDVARMVAWIRSHGPTTKKTVVIPTRGVGNAGRGAPLYASYCERCHGNTQARGNAVHLANSRFLEVASDAFLGWAISQGRPGTQMVPWRGNLTEAQIDDVVAYVRSFEKPTPSGSLPAPTGQEPIVLNPGAQHPAFAPRSTPCLPNAPNADAAPPCTPDMRFVSVAQVKQALDAKRRMVIIDARPPSDWMRVHIPGAVSIPYHDLKRLDEVPKDGTWVIAYCACPHHLSGDVVNALRQRGVQHSVILDEGILEWHRRGYPVVAAPGVERPAPLAPLQPIAPLLPPANVIPSAASGASQVPKNQQVR